VIELRGYIDGNGRKPFETWFEALDSTAAKVAVALARIEQGNLSNAKRVGSGVHEYRIHFGPGYRVCFGRDGDRLSDPARWRHEETPGERYSGGADVLGRLQSAQETGDG